MNLKLHEMIDMHSKYDKMHTNGIFNSLICINNHVNSYINYMLSQLMCGRLSFLGHGLMYELYTFTLKQLIYL